MFPPFLQERWKQDNIRTIPVAMRWTLAAERAHTIGLEAVIDLALEVCGSAASERPPDVAG